MKRIKMWSKVFKYIGFASLITFVLIIIRIRIGFEYPSQSELYSTLKNVKFIPLIIGVLTLMIGFAVNSIYTEISKLSISIGNKKADR